MITIRRSNERGHLDHGWLNTYHTFSFGDYYDSAYLGFRKLRVINEDWVQAGKGFGMHGHSDMEIITYIVEGELEHQDSMGNGSVIRAGEIQRITAGTGVEHSEFNASKTNPVHLLQIWILPEKQGMKPSYEQAFFSEADRINQLKLVGSPLGRERSVTIHQDTNLYVSILEKNQQLSTELDPNRSAWLQVIRGTVDVNGLILKAGDGAALIGEKSLRIGERESTSEFLFFDLA